MILTLLGAAGLPASVWVVALSVSVSVAAAFAARPSAAATPPPAPRPEGRHWATAIALGATAWVLADWFALSLPSIEHLNRPGEALRPDAPVGETIVW